MSTSVEKLLKVQQSQIALFKAMAATMDKPVTKPRGKHFYQQFLKEFEKAWAEIRGSHKELVQHAQTDKGKELLNNDYMTENQFGVMHELYLTTWDQVSEDLHPDKEEVPHTECSFENRRDFQNTLKLPKITLDKFDGDYLNWPSFHDLFRSLIHDNASLTSAQKLQYLKMHLTGEPEHLLRHYKITDNNYSAAWETLKDRYENKRILVNTQLKRLLSQKVLQQERAYDIRVLLDTTNECLLALKNLDVNVEGWEPIIIYLTVQKLPSQTHQLWEQAMSKDKNIPSWQELEIFLDNRFRALEAVSTRERAIPDHKSKTNFRAFHNTNRQTCVLCEGQHLFRKCPRFLSLTVNERLEKAREKKVCLNCLGEGHRYVNCPSQGRCMLCKKPHHSLLHLSSSNSSQSGQLSPQATSFSPVKDVHTYVTHQRDKTTIILATALIKLVSPTGHTIIARALVDPGSQVSLLTEDMAQQLHLVKERVNVQIHGVGENILEKPRAQTRVILRSVSGADETTITGLVVRKITNMLPEKEVTHHELNFLEGSLADPEYYKPSKVDVLLGADCYPHIMLEGRQRKINNTLLAQQTIFGWILCGNIDNSSSIKKTCYSFHINTCLETQIKKFWEIENIPEVKPQTEEERLCESMYKKSTIRLSSGKYEVSIPFRETTSSQFLGASRNIALRQLYQLEARFKRDETFKNEYSKVVQEYLKLGHMIEVTQQEKSYETVTTPYSYTTCYLPHHGVLKESSTTTKLRVVFDASRATSSGTSLNEMMLKGPVIQDDLVEIFIRWRKHKIALTADIEKMYRQVRIKDSHAEYQRIVWRENPQHPIKDYKLLTVIFGTKSAPYLATRTLQQLAYDEAHNYPYASKVALSDFYVDDLLSGADDIESALQIKDQMMNLMASGGFPLHKWMSNAPELTAVKHNSDQKLILPSSQADKDEVKTLGISWNPTLDYCYYSVNFPPIQQKYSKRMILSQISKLFDPLGWLTPTIIIGKIMMQKLWLEGLTWDETLSNELQQQWANYYARLVDISNIRVPRWIQYSTRNSKIELHVFADASIKAYAAVVYLCNIDQAGNRRVSLISAKSKVAPIKTISLPRLELCASSLAAKLIQLVKGSLNLKEDISIYGWSDSEIVLAWLKEHPSKWTTFVANRVSHIHDILKKNVWSHVPTKQNPADCATRGLYAAELIHHKLWWNGPEWLTKTMDFWPPQKQATTDLEKRKSLTCHATTLEYTFENNFSSLTRLVRVIAYCRRFMNNVKQNSTRQKGHLRAPELQKAIQILIQRSQQRTFPIEMKLCLNNTNMAKTNSLKKLNPFLDQEDILRVGGRLKFASLSYSEKHPIILSDKDVFTKLLLDKTHKECLHGGPQLMLCVLRKRYWIINARNAIRFQIYKCIQCFKQKAETRTQLMGNLPKSRVQMARPFSHSGLDYCGPFELKTHKGRGAKKYKSYVALFICMSIKAIHLELVTDLSAEGFIAAFRRFCSRRGLCTDLYCDCGTNFVGANRILANQKHFMVGDIKLEIAEFIENIGINFHFNPPGSPHFGGLWEAGVRSTKYHLKRILANTILTYEEFTTVLTQIEACLNSRPLCELTNDPQDLTPLTPAHFLIGDSMLTPPQQFVLDLNLNRLDRWQHLQHILQSFWRRWNSEYLSRLQQRPKWNQTFENVKVGDLVIIKDENLPPCKWLLARITDTHPGSDGLVRVVTLRTKNSIFKRPITKLCVLPIENQTA